MKNIRRWLENDQMNNGQNYEIEEYEGHLEARTDTVIFMIVEPHSGTKNRWMLRVSTRSASDRWANSTAIEEFFDRDIENNTIVICKNTLTSRLMFQKCLFHIRLLP